VAEENGDEAAKHTAFIDHVEAKQARDALMLEDFQLRGSDRDPYKALDELEAIRSKMEAASLDVKKPKQMQPKGWEHRAREIERAKRPKIFR
jgi:hypothetical protein